MGKVNYSLMTSFCSNVEVDQSSIANGSISISMTSLTLIRLSFDRHAQHRHQISDRRFYGLHHPNLLCYLV
jgi:hypothetical protein